MNRNYTITLMHEAVSPITQMEGTVGNVAYLMRRAVAWNGEVHRVPCLTGNAFRNRLLREPGAHILKARLGLYGHLSTHMDRFLSSGQERSVKGNSVDVGLLRRGFELIPHVRLLGGTLPSEVVRGRSSVGFGVLMCRETENERRALLPREWPMEQRGLISWQGLVERRTYTRNSDETDAALREGQPRERAMMIFESYTVASGAIFLQRIDLNNVREIDAGAACAAIEMWDGTIGGQKSRGHGRLNTSYIVHCGGKQVEAQPLIDAFEQHLEANKAAMAEWIFQACGEEVPEGVADATR